LIEFRELLSIGLPPFPPFPSLTLLLVEGTLLPILVGVAFKLRFFKLGNIGFIAFIFIIGFWLFNCIGGIAGFIALFICGEGMKGGINGLILFSNGLTGGDGDVVGRGKA